MRCFFLLYYTFAEGAKHSMKSCQRCFGQWAFRNGALACFGTWLNEIMAYSRWPGVNPVNEHHFATCEAALFVRPSEFYSLTSMYHEEGADRLRT